MINPIKKLQYLLRYYDKKFHLDGKQLISEAHRDYLRKQLEYLENKYPEYKNIESPTEIIGYRDTNYEKITRTIPMLSLENVYDLDVLYKKIKNYTDPVYLEPKIDGVALSIVYDNHISSLSLRGNGYEGEDIFFLWDKIINIPPVIQNFSGEIRGELYIPGKNTRSLVSGAIRKKNNNQILFFIPYRCLNYTNYEDQYEFLCKYFKVLDKIICNKQDIENTASIMYNKSYDFDIDGIVIKNNIFSLESHKRYVKDAIAYKFNEQGIQTVIKNILWQMNRKGQLLPLIEIDPVLINDSKISKVYAYNKNYIEMNNIDINAKVYIEKKGKVIPKIQKVENNSIYILLSCPFCETKIKSDILNYFCANTNCQEKNFQNVYYFFSNLDIGIGEKTMRSWHTWTGNYIEEIYNSLIYIQNNRFTHKNYIKIQDKLINIQIDYKKLLNYLPISDVGNLDNLTPRKEKILQDFLNQYEHYINLLKNFFKIIND